MLRAVPAGALLLALACSSHSDPIAHSIATTFEQELGVKPRTVRCGRTDCTLTLPDGTDVAVKVDGKRAVTWETAELLDLRAVAAGIASELDDLGAPQTVDCGALQLAPAAPVTIECRLGGGGAAWATVDATGGVDLELAITAAIAGERRAGPGDAVLEAQSRALDSDEAEGRSADPTTDDDDDDRRASDAGVDSAIARGLGG